LQGRLRVIATIQDPAVVRAILAHLWSAPGPDGPADRTVDTRVAPARSFICKFCCSRITFTW
jgi:hypothetical protein